MRPKRPTLSASPSDSVIPASTPVTLTCATDSSGSTATNYIFYKNTNIIYDGPLDTYSVASVTTADSGAYSCVASINNVASLESPSYSFTVEGK